MQDNEIWLPLEWPEFKGLYLISSYGRIKSLPRLKHTPLGGTYLSKEKILKTIRTKNGYLNVTLSNKPINNSIYVHILVASVFVANPHGYKFVNHDDGDKQNNHYTNLKWCTRSQNMLHAFQLGLIAPRKKAPHRDAGLNQRLTAI